MAGGWKARGWQTAAKQPVKNEDLWKRLDQARARHDVDWRWVKGHAGHELNERADGLARKGLEQARAPRSCSDRSTTRPAIWPRCLWRT